MTVDPRMERNTRSVVALRSLIVEILRNPAAFADNEAVIKALKSQGALSKYSDMARGIQATSLNTIKRISAKVLQEGFEDFDRMRIVALEAINTFRDRSERSNKTTKIGLTRRVAEMEVELQQALQDIWHITMAFEKALSQGRYYAQQSDNPAILALCLKEQRELRAILSLSKHPIVKGQPKEETDERG